ncbi:OmpA family protein [Nocardiopsis sp. CT-R113]|uniref:OmpA family protein n=1 Tax=Nocardiopsis codii TaxID=3065942 RepID=A0ABU7K9L4_9ACTN|nr:OmpA family protein [Nocardiopsis sp. CT-R113]MEE2038926.1 OmpA family protein [Nocardiopsis sp. CT-R113]
MAGEALVTVVMLIGPAWLATRLGWPIEEETTWTWFWQYLRGGTVPDELVIAALVVILWGLWGAHLVVVVLDVIALLRGLVPRVGLVRLIWVLLAGGTTAASTHTSALAARTDIVAEAPAQHEPGHGPQTEHATGKQAGDQESRVVDRTRTLSGFGFDSDKLSPEMKESLEPTLGMINDFGAPDVPVTVTGHTDPVGAPAYNQYLSEQRAQAVAGYLAQHLGEEVEFEVLGAGSTQPPDDPQVSYGEYRRVDVAYALQPPIAPEPAEESEVDQAPDTESVQERVRLDVATASGQSPGPNAALVGTVAGAAGVGVGYVAGRRHGRTRREQPAREAQAPDDAGADLASLATAEPVPGESGLLREDPLGLDRGVIDEDGYVLVSDTVRVDGRGGIAFVGAHAVPVLAAVVTDHAPRPVVATRAAVARLGGAEALPSGLRVVADIPGARIAVETELLTAERCSLDEEDGPRGDGQPLTVHPRMLVVCEAGDLDTGADLLQMLTATPGTVAGVLGDPGPLGAVVQCDDLGRIHLRSPQGETVLPLPLRYRVRSATDTNAVAPDPARPEAAPVPEATPGPVAECEGEESASETPHRVQVRLFASEPVLTFHGQPVTGLRTVARTLLAFLALHPEGADAEQIADVCFADADPVKVTARRRNAIHSLRATLRELLHIPGEQIILNDQGLYRIDESVFDVDLWQFLRATSALRKEEGNAPQGHRERVLGMHKENLLCGRHEDWILPARERCVKEIVDVCVNLAESAELGSDRIHYLEKAISFDACNEPLYQRIMVAHRDIGSPEGAHRSYRALKENLESLGESPSCESRRIVRDCAPTSL